MAAGLSASALKKSLSASMGKEGSLISTLLIGGVMDKTELKSALQGFGYNLKSEIPAFLAELDKSMASLAPASGGASAADSLVKGVLPSQEEFDSVMAKEMANLTASRAMSDALKDAQSISAEQFIKDLESSPGFIGPLGSGGGGNDLGVGSAISQDVWAKALEAAGGDWTKVTTDSLAQAEKDLASEEGGGAGSVGKKSFSSIMGDVWGTIKSNVSSALGAGGGKNDKPPSWLTSWGASALGDGLKMPGPLPNGFLGAFGLTSLLPLVGALGLAGGGAIAGTAIGGAGTLMAVLPGILDLTKGMAAYTALSTGASTKGMSAAQLGLGKSLGTLFGAGGKGLGAAETMVMPQITKFLGALDKALPSIEKFGTVGIKAMSGFFDAIDKGLASKGFALFMAQMTKDLGPIMKDFGKTFINMGLVFGNFLKIFGGAPAKIVGAWFVKITGELATFSAHAKLGHGFIQGMKTAFGDLDPVLKLVWAAFDKLTKALVPLGFQTLKLVKGLAELGLKLVHLIPTNLLTAVAGIVLAIMGVYKAIMIVRGGMIAFRTIAETLSISSGPLGLIVVALVAIGVGAYELYKHWNTVWTFIKRVALDAWHFLDHLLHNNIVQGILFVVAPLVLLGLHWRTVWHDITTVLKDAWKLIQPVLHLISAGISDVLNPVKGLMAVGGAIGHGISSVGHMLGFAGGGTPPVGVPSIVGENGPELFVPDTAGTIVPNGQFGGGVRIYVDARGSADPGAVRTQAARGVASSLPALQAALARGAA